MNASTTTTRTPAYHGEQADPLRPTLDTMYTCRQCSSTWSVWDLRVQLNANGAPELACPDCSLRDATEDGVDLDVLPAPGHCTMPL